MVIGQISSAGSLFTALIDSGATHSFVAARVIDQLCRPSILYARGFQTLLPTGELVVSRRWVRALPVVIDGRELFVDLVELDMDDFDIILGMDWLTRYGATIDCRRRMVTFEPEGEAPFVFVGSVDGPWVPMISALKARDLMQEGCIGFLVSIVDSSKVAAVGPNETRVVCEFPDLFPSDLPGLPPQREIEFGIELAPGAEPVSKAPYRMAPAELKELKIQLQELLNLGFVRPSFSSWGAPVLFVKKKDGTLRMCIDYR